MDFSGIFYTHTHTNCWLLPIQTMYEKWCTITATNVDVLECTLEVESTGFRLKVTVAVDLQARMLENGRVVAPARRRQVDLFVAGPVCAKEGAADSQRTRSTDRLHGSHRWWGHLVRVLAQSQCGRQFGELGVAADSQVFFVQFGVGDVFLGLFGRNFIMQIIIAYSRVGKTILKNR